jgi:hypothetical protein
MLPQRFLGPLHVLEQVLRVAQQNFPTAN